METKVRIGAIIIQNKKLLLVKGKKEKELWTPGGKIESESEIECLKRELKEEIDVNLVSYKYFKEFSSPSFYSSGMTVSKIYVVEVDGNPNPKNEIEKIVWLTKDDFLNKKYSMIPIIEKEIIPAIILAGYF